MGIATELNVSIGVLLDQAENQLAGRRERKEKEGMSWASVHAARVTFLARAKGRAGGWYRFLTGRSVS